MTWRRSLLWFWTVVAPSAGGLKFDQFFKDTVRSLTQHRFFIKIIIFKLNEIKICIWMSNVKTISKFIFLHSYYITIFIFWLVMWILNNTSFYAFFVFFAVLQTFEKAIFSESDIHNLEILQAARTLFLAQNYLDLFVHFSFSWVKIGWHNKNFLRSPEVGEKQCM